MGPKVKKKSTEYMGPKVKKRRKRRVEKSYLDESEHSYGP